MGGTSVSIEQLALVPVVGTATELDVLYHGLAPHAVRVDVMELDEGPLVAASPTLAYESADTAVTQPHRALNLGRNIATAPSRATTGSRPVRRRELLPDQIFEQRRQRPIDDFRRSPLGMAWRSRSWARRSFSRVWALAVNRMS
jgi:hypothetical protein